MNKMVSMEQLVEHLLPLTRGPERHLVALVGAPGAGKSYIAESLGRVLLAQVPGSTEVLPMDGFHYDDILLRARGDLARKGAPHTFDVEGLRIMLQRVAADDGDSVAIPVFDRSLEIARAGARVINPEARLIIVEGNYLLLNQPDWSALADGFALTIFLQVPEETLESRLRQRWAHLSNDQRDAKLNGNDLPNMRLVIQNSRPSDVSLDNG